MKRSVMGILPSALTRTLVIAAIFVAWEIGAHFGNPLFVAPPSAVVPKIFEIAGQAQVSRALATTAWELASAFGIALLIGVPVALLTSSTPLTRKSVYPIILLIYAVPQVTILPLFVLALGPGSASKVAFGVSHGIFPIVISLISGLQNVDPLLLRSARSMGASRGQVLRRIVLPSVTPSLFAGMRLGMAATLLGVLLAELYVTTRGIGYLTRIYTDNFRPAELFALIVILAFFAILLNELFRLYERRLTRWRTGTGAS